MIWTRKMKVTGRVRKSLKWEESDRDEKVTDGMGNDGKEKGECH